ncbi:MAG: undecaprenyl-diphosphate phosphatase [Bacilli bacterium]
MFFKKKKEYFFEWKYLIFIIISTIPIVLFTILIKLLGYNTSPLFIIGISLVFNAIMLLILSKIKGQRKKEEMTIQDALVIGLFQCLGVFPGISRSGSCISGAMVRKIEKEEAANYAFMLFVPAVIGAFVLELGNISLIFTLDSKMISCYLASFLVSMVATFYAFKILLNLIKKGKLFYFSIYCLIIGILTFIYSSMNGWI